MDAERFALDLARTIRTEVAPLLGRPEARRRAGTAAGGDPTYGIDEVAERVVARRFQGIDDVAYFTEDVGLVVRGAPKWFFLIDPVDGSRPAAAGFETCCVTIGVAPYGADLTLGDVTYGCIVELATDAVFEARRGGGGRVQGRSVEPTGATSPSGMFWAGGFRGQPALPTAIVLGDLFDAPGAEGAFFDQGSAAYSLTRVATGQVDAFVDPGPALIEAVPALEDAFRKVGGGHVLNTTTYDTAAGYLLLWELGLPATDALGRPLTEVPLLDSEGKATAVSTVTTATEELHAALLDAVGRGLERLKATVEALGPQAVISVTG